MHTTPQPNLFRDLFNAIPNPVKLLMVLFAAAFVIYHVDALALPSFDGWFLNSLDDLQALQQIVQEQTGGPAHVDLNWTNGERTLIVAITEVPESVSAVQDTIREFASTELQRIDTLVLCEPAWGGMSCEQFL